MSISVKNLSYTYMPKTPYEHKALDCVSFEVAEGDFLGIIGPTGSGKSTMVQHLNGLIKLTDGDINIFDINLKNKPDYRRLRGIVGMVFQYPEYQLFEETVAKDVAFGPKNMGLSSEEIDTRVRQAIEIVGLDYNEVKDRSPFELSGGQKRRAAIAGVIAMQPKILVLDEPTAGLDPVGRTEIYKLIDNLKNHCTPTVIMISHSMDEISRHATRMIVLYNGRICFDMPTKQLFIHQKELIELGLDIPVPVKIRAALAERGIFLPEDIVTPEELVDAIAKRRGL